MNIVNCARRGRSLALAGLIGLGFLLLIPTAKATNWQANIKPGSDIVMNDLRWPVWDAGTYYCFWYMSFYPKFSALYGGVAVHGPDKIPGMFTSYWCVTESVYEGPEFYAKGFGAEGSKGGANGAPTFQRPNSWYRMVMRTFPPTRGAEGKTNVGWWVKDIEQNKWYTHSVLRIPKAVTGFQANSGFVEALAPESTPRAFERRFGYCRLDGEWHDSPLSANDERKFKLIENDTIVRFDRAGSDGGAKQEQTFYRTKQAATPTLDKPAIDQAQAHAWGKQVSVKWTIPQSASPQLGYKLEAFAGSDANGQALATWEDAAPHIISKRLDTKVHAKSIRLTVTDIFDQQVAVVIPVKNITIPAPATAAESRIRAGLNYVYYEDPNGETWQKLPDFATLKPVKQGYVKTLDDTVREDRATGYAIRYKGYLRVPADGLYVISAGTSDGSRLYVDGELVAENDGIHSTSQTLYSLALSKGLRAFELEYFKGANDGNSRQSTTAKIAISWEGPGFEMRKLAREDLSCDDSADIPSATLVLNSAVSAGVLEDNMARIQVGIERREQSIQKLQLFAGKVLLTTKRGADFDDRGNVEIEVLLPEGQNLLWARLWFGDGHSIDSANELELEARNRIAEPWQFDSMLKGGFPLAVRGETDSASFMGEGFGFVHQTVAGDFTLSARIADMPLSSKENGLWPSNWLGLSVLSKHSNPKVRITDRSPYHSEISVFLTAEGKMKGGKDFPDLAGSNKSIASFEAAHRWLRLVRRGRRYQSFTSADGKAWQLADERFATHAPKEVYAGVCFRSGPNKSRSLFQGTVDRIKLENSVPRELREKPRKEDLHIENRITALVQAANNPETLYARSTDRGLLKSTDRGDSWDLVNRGLSSPDAMAVRSVAVHPENHSIVLRAGGSVVGGELQSGLLRSEDGGESWKLVTREIDFDGGGPTTLFGEVVMFCPQDPDLVVAGGETKGLFISRDAGETWTNIALSGERITSMAFSPQPNKSTKSPTLVVGTFADSEFKTLGLGKPATPVDEPGRIYWINLSSGEKPIKPSRVAELKDFGVTNMVFDTQTNFVNFATTRGVYYTWVHCAVYAKRKAGTSGDRLFTAIGARPFDDWSKLTCTAPFSGQEQNPIYFTTERSRNWSALSDNSKIGGNIGTLALNAGISCLLPDAAEDNTLYLCNRHGVFKTTDKGKSYQLVLGTAKR
ncbi:MAG: hypothetical protein ACI9NC_001955 [Verrucomicrobiales bacterium]|jgi:hypothetical protein